MKRLDDDKVSLVDFLRSIKFNQCQRAQGGARVSGHFAELNPRARPAQPRSAEDALLVRSAN